MVGTDITKDDLRVLGGEWKANHVRWQLTWGGFPRSPADKGDLAAYDAWLEGALGEGLLDWPQLAEAAAKKVRAVDPDHAIVIEPAPWGGPEAVSHFAPIDVPNVVYSVHMYLPHPFTHQGVYDNPRGFEYPGLIQGVKWDKDRLRLALKPALDFQRDYGVAMYVGEFSAIRWAPGESACDYLRDVIEIMEEYGWDWAYHAFREWDGWSVEHGPDPKDRSCAKSPTSRRRLLCSWYAKNQRPDFGRGGK